MLQIKDLPKPYALLPGIDKNSLYIFAVEDNQELFSPLLALRQTHLTNLMLEGRRDLKADGQLLVARILLC